jgi:hypothetical protein
MKKTLSFLAIAATVATLAAPSLFADSRHQDRTNGEWRHSRNSRGLVVEGRIRDIDRERNGFVIRLDRGDALLFAERHTDVVSYARNRGGDRTRVRDLDRGDKIRATGYADSRGYVIVQRIDLVYDGRNDGRYDDGRYDDRNGRDARYLTGTVQSLDLRHGLLVVRDDRTGRFVTVTVRYREHDDASESIDNLRRGDRVVVGGELQRNGEVEADRIDRERRR